MTCLSDVPRYELTQPINYLSSPYDGDVAAAERAYNIRGNYPTDFVHMGARFLSQGSGGLNSDILESHDYQPASPRGHYQHNTSPVPGYRPPDLAPTRNPEAHQSASRRPMYTPMSGVGSDHPRTHGTSEESSPPLEVSEHSQSRYNMSK